MTTIARTPEEICEEAARLRRFCLAYEKLIELFPNDSPLRYEAVGGLAVIDWLSGQNPALSDCLGDVLRWGVAEFMRRQRRGQKEGGQR